MKLLRSHVARFRGTSRYRLTSPNRNALSPPRLMVEVDPWFSPNELLESEEHGFVLPGESAQDDLKMFADIDSGSAPADSVFTLYFQVEGGERKEVVHHYDGMDAVVSLPISKEWTRAAIGKHFSLDYQVEWPDGTRLAGAGITIRVHPVVEISPIRIEGAGYGETIDPAVMPDSITFTVERMRNAEPFHNARLRMLVEGITPDGFIGPAYDTTYPLPNIGGGPYILRVPKWQFIRPYEEGWTDMRVRCLSLLVMAPPPNTQADWGTYVQMGQNKIVPPAPR